MYTSPKQQRGTGHTRSQAPVTGFYVPQNILDVCGERSLAVAIYALVARLWIGSKGPVALTRAAIQAFDPSATTRRIVNASSWLTKQQLLSVVKIGGRNHYVPMFLLRNGTSTPWSADQPRYGRPESMAFVVAPFRLFDAYLGTLTTHSYAPATVSRYTTKPLLSLDDVGAYIINMHRYTRGHGVFTGTKQHPYDLKPLLNQGLLQQRENGFIDVVSVPSLDSVLQHVAARSWGNPAAIGLTPDGQARIGIARIQLAPADETVPDHAPLLGPQQLVGLSINDVISLPSTKGRPQPNENQRASVDSPTGVPQVEHVAPSNLATYQLLSDRQCLAAHQFADLPYDAVFERLQEKPAMVGGAITINFRLDPPTKTRIQRYKDAEALATHRAADDHVALVERDAAALATHRAADDHAALAERDATVHRDAVPAPWAADWMPTTQMEALQAWQCPSWWGSPLPRKTAALVYDLTVLGTDGQPVQNWPPTPTDTVVLIVQDAAAANVLNAVPTTIRSLVQTIADSRDPLDVGVAVRPRQRRKEEHDE